MYKYTVKHCYIAVCQGQATFVHYSPMKCKEQANFQTDFIHYTMICYIPIKEVNNKVLK